MSAAFRNQAFVDSIGLAIATRHYKLLGYAPPPWYGVTSECPTDRQPLSLQQRCEYSAMAVEALEASGFDEIADTLQQFVNGVETHMIDSPADDILANITRRARAALAKARGDQ